MANTMHLPCASERGNGNTQLSQSQSQPSELSRFQNPDLLLHKHQPQLSLLAPHHTQHLGQLCDAALAAAQGDADKVRANGVRAVGGLLGLLSPGLAEHAGLDVGRCGCICCNSNCEVSGML